MQTLTKSADSGISSSYGERCTAITKMRVPDWNGILEFFEVPSRATFLVPPWIYGLYLSRCLDSVSSVL